FPDPPVLRDDGARLETRSVVPGGVELGAVWLIGLEPAADGGVVEVRLPHAGLAASDRHARRRELRELILRRPFPQAGEEVDADVLEASRVRGVLGPDH